MLPNPLRAEHRLSKGYRYPSDTACHDLDTILDCMAREDPSSAPIACGKEGFGIWRATESVTEWRAEQVGSVSADPIPLRHSYSIAVIASREVDYEVSTVFDVVVIARSARRRM